MNKYNYFPVVKTTDAELKAYEHLPSVIKENIVPIIELTRSRRSKKNPIGNISKNIERLEKILPNNAYFILDVSMDKFLVNNQILKLIQHNNNFVEWCNYIKNMKKTFPNLIPIIHYDVDFRDDNIGEIDFLNKNFDYLAFRVDINDTKAIDYIDDVLKYLAPNKLILILDKGFVDVRDTKQGDASHHFVPILNELMIKPYYNSLCKIIYALSSFPTSVLSNGYNSGDKSYGSFPAVEIFTGLSLVKKYRVSHGDYASIHPVRYETYATLTPRIDFINNNHFFYFRTSIESGGYISLAQKVINSPMYHIIEKDDIWADKEIALAAQGNPTHKNPSHWISIRMNRYIVYRFLSIQEKYQNP